MKDTASTATDLTVPERLLLLCLASGTDWHRARITQSTLARMSVRGFTQWDLLGRLSLTKEGRAALDALLQRPA